MESIMRIKFYPACFAVAFLLLSVKSLSQQYSGAWGTLTEKPNTAIDEMINGYIEVLPPGYNDPGNTTKYPLLIYIEGAGQFGNGSTTELQTLYGLNEGMMPDIVRNDLFPNSYLVGGTTYQFIVIIPQIRWQVKNRPFAEQMASPTEVNDIINYALQNYRVDEDRIYLSGLSLGGGSTWNYAGQSTVYANRLAAIIPHAGASDLADNTSRDDNIAQANLPVWTFVTSSDDTYKALAQTYIDAILANPAHTPSTDALITIYTRGANDHNSWQQPMEGGNTLEGGNTGGTSNPSNIYVWMLGKSRTLTQPVFATVNAGTDQTLNLPNSSMIVGSNGISFTGSSITLNGGSPTPAPGRSITTTEWIKIDGVGGTITSPNSLSTTVTNLKPGSYTYQLRVTDDQGLTTVDNINVTVNKPPENKYFKIEAENYSSVSGAQIERTYIDEGPDYGLGFLGNGNWMEYSVIVPNAGTYDLYYRYLTFGAQPIQIIVNGTTYNTTLSGTNAGSWTTSKISVSLGTSNTIRFLSQGNSWQNFNYFELALTSSLPVKFVYFNSQCKDGNAQLQWKTADEQNTNRFSVQRSKDGISWNEVGSVVAAGQTNQERSYSFIDRTGSTSANLYRIVEYDHTGQQIMSTIVRSNCSLSGNSVSLYPNPSSGISALSITLQQGSRVNIQVLDNRGSVLQQRGILLPAGSSSIPLDLSSYADGVYTINIQYNGERKALELIKN
jgi:hypothetical protein